jgi:hypothetical protein
MSAALGVVGVSLVIVLMITAVATLAWRKRVLRRRDETPEERYSHAVSHLRSRSRTRRVRNDGAVGSIWAAIFVPVNYLHLGGDGDGDSGDDGGGCGGGGCGGGGD